jgi:dienelactone hydrolase
MMNHFCLLLTLFAFSAACAEAPFSAMPAEFVAMELPGRSPLIFRDGSVVKTAAEWPRRRAEIIAEWQSMLGEWPPLLVKPDFEVLETFSREGGITQQRLRIEIAPGQHGEGILLLPKQEGKRPAVFVPFYEPETSVGLGGKPRRDFAWQLAQRGLVSLAIGSPGGDAREPVMAAEARCQPLHYLGYLSANMWHLLASLPQVDEARIGIVGHSYGGKWALFGSCFWEKYACAVWSDPGIVFDESRPSINYQEPWYLGLDPQFTRTPGLVSEASLRTGAYRVLIERGHDLTELHALMAPRPLLVSGGAEDPPKRWLPLRHAIAVNALLGHDDRVAMTNRPTHDPTAESNEQLCRFLEHWLRP